MMEPIGLNVGHVGASYLLQAGHVHVLQLSLRVRQFVRIVLGWESFVDVHQQQIMFWSLIELVPKAVELPLFSLQVLEYTKRGF